MLIYWSIWLWICAITMLSLNNTKKIEWQILFLLTMFFLVCFVGLRYEVGGDWNNYLMIYEKYANFSEVLASRDIGYSLLNYMSNLLGVSDTILVNLICSLLVVICLYFFAKKNENYWLILLCYFPYHLLVVSTGYTRQSVAIAFSLVFFYFLSSKKIFKALIFLFLACIFHNTAIVLLLFLPIIFFNKVGKYEFVLNNIYLLLSLIVLFLLAGYFSMTGDNIYLKDDMQSRGFILRWVSHLIPLFLFLYLPKEKIGKHVLNILRYGLFIIFFLAIIGFFYSTLADRFNLYLVFFDLMVIAYIVPSLTNVKKLLLILVLILFYTTFISIWMFYGEWASKAWIPYQNYVINYLLERVF